MHTLHIIVNNKEAIYSARDGSIVCGNDDYQVQFALDSEWDGLAAKARFRWNGKHQDMPIVDGLAAVPRITNAHEVRVGVYSEDGSLQTTTAARVPCDKSILCGDSTPTEGNEAHYASEAQEAADRAEAAAERAEAAGGNGGTGGGVVIDPESVNQAQEAAEAAAASAEAASTSATVAAREAGNASKSAAAAATDRTAAQAAQAAAQTAMERAEAAADRAEGADTAAYEPATDDLPRIYLEGDLPVSKTDNDKPMTMTYVSKTARFFSYITAAVQGSGSTVFLKKNLTIKLFSEEARDKNCKLNVVFRNWPSKNKFVLKANFIDRTHARNIVTCRIFADMAKTRANFESLPEPLRESPNMGCVDGFPVKLFANGVYQGLYTLNVPKDDWMAGMNEKDDASKDKVAIICGEGVYNKTTGQDGVKQVTFNEAYSNPAHIINGYDWSDELGTVGATTRANFKVLADLIVNGTDEEFKANISTYVDMESLIDAFLMTWLDCGGDSIGKNQLWFTYNSGHPWIISQYDVDSTWGGYANGAKGTWYDPETPFQDGYAAVTGHGGTKNMLYERLWHNFPDAVRARWNEVKHGALSLANIIQHFEAFHEPIPVELFAEDSAPTTADGGYMVTIPSENNDKLGFDVVNDIDTNNVQQIRNFAAKRWAYVDKEINRIECTGITLSSSTLSLTADNTTAALVATLSPDGCNQPVVWTSSDEAVAKVNGGTVTGIFNGSCVITATCGKYSATCTVTVSGFSEVESDNLADLNDKYWLDGYYFAGNNKIPQPTDPSVAHQYAISNLIEIRANDVIEISGANSKYSPKGGALVGFYNYKYEEREDGKLDACYVLIGCNVLEDNGWLTVSGGVTTYKFPEDYLKTIYKIETFGDRIGGYIRLQLGTVDNRFPLDTKNIIIRRNPNGENPGAWA